MALKLGDFILFGEIDNRTRGRIRGTFIINSSQELITLDLEGDCHSDLAGSSYVFYNSSSRKWKGPLLQSLQKGLTGDICASKKVKVSDLPPDELVNNPTAFHWGNSTFIEWFADDGPIIIELTNILHRQSQFLWSLEPADEKKLLQQNQQNRKECLNRLISTTPEERQKQEQEKAEQQAENSFRQIQRIHELKNSLQLPEFSFDTVGENLDEQEDYLSGLSAFESPQKNSPLLQGVTFLPSDDIHHDHDIEYHMWRAIYFLAAQSVYLSFTDHLTDRQLYELITLCILKDSSVNFVVGGNWETTLFAYEYADDPETVNLKYYSTKEERIHWFDYENGEAMPEMASTVANRDKLLPGYC